MKLTVIPATKVSGAALLNLWVECTSGRRLLHITVNGAEVLDVVNPLTGKPTTTPLPSPIPVDDMPTGTLARLVASLDGITATMKGGAA